MDETENKIDKAIRTVSSHSTKMQTPGRNALINGGCSPGNP